MTFPDRKRSGGSRASQEPLAVGSGSLAQRLLFSFKVLEDYRGYIDRLPSGYCHRLPSMSLC